MSDININIKVPAAEKLIDVVASDIGAVAGPLLLPYKAKMQAKADVTEAKGKAEAMKIMAQGKGGSTEIISQAQSEARKILTQASNNTSVVQIKTDVAMDVENLIQTKIQFQERKRLSNLQKIVSQTQEKLPDQVGNEPVDPDWTARFFQSAQDVSAEEMQQIWSSILAGEVEFPGRTSLRTLEILKNMTKKDAELFSSIMRYTVGASIFKNIKSINDHINFKYSDILLLGELGLIQMNADLSIKLKRERYTELGSHGDHFLRLYTESRDKDIHVPVYKLTQPAKELSLFLDHSTDFKYLKLLSQFFKQRDCQLQAAKILRKGGTYVDCDTDGFKSINPDLGVV